MARRKRKEDEADWVPREFDEVGYMRQEIQGAHAAIATIGWAVIGAVVALLLYAVLPVLAFFAGIAVGSGMYSVFLRIGINTAGFKSRDALGPRRPSCIGDLAGRHLRSVVLRECDELHRHYPGHRHERAPSRHRVPDSARVTADRSQGNRLSKSRVHASA